jgi:hypothetical protein
LSNDPFVSFDITMYIQLINVKKFGLFS